MNKIIYISIGAVWLILLSIIIAGVLVAPDLDMLGSLQRYKTVGQEYLDRKQVDSSKIKINNADDEFIYTYAKYLQAFQQSENDYFSSQRLFRASLEPQNIGSIEQITAAYQKLDSLAKQTQRSYDILVQAQDNMIAELRAMKDKDQPIYGKVVDSVISMTETDEVQFRDSVTQYRLAVEKYYKAILDFLSQKQGAYKVAGGLVTFTQPEDQQYYDQLKQGQKQYEQEITKAFEDYQQVMRKANSEIPVDIK